jgi:hypothetical protein
MDITSFTGQQSGEEFLLLQSTHANQICGFVERPAVLSRVLDRSGIVVVGENFVTGAP